MKIVIASDHAGFEMKEYLIKSLIDLDMDVRDMGPDSYDENDDYPDYIKRVGEYISEHDDPDVYRGIVIGGSGQGENICANKFKNVRSILIYGNDLELNTSVTILSRKHNNANVISFAARFITKENALHLLKIWLDENFPAEERHTRRLSKIEN